MNIETVREYCLSLPMVTEDMAFGEGVLLFRVCDKIFACMHLASDSYMALKCDPEYALELRDRYAEINPAYHWNKKYWNQLPIMGTLDNGLLLSLIRHSYSEVVKKLTKKIKTAHPELLDIKP